MTHSRKSQFKIKFSKNMKIQEWQLEDKEPKRKFNSEKEAYMYGIQRWGSGALNERNGWFIKEVK